MNDYDFKEYNLGEAILRSLSILEYKKLTGVQGKVIPLILEGKDIVVKSQTGSGKTADFEIPICEKIIIEEKDPPGTCSYTN